MRPFLDLLKRAEVEALRALGRERRFPGRAVLMHQGDPSRYLILITEGWVKVSAESRRGDEMLLALRGPNDILGELAALDGKSRSATVAALVPVRAHIIPDQRFIDYLKDSPAVAFAMLSHVAARLRESDAERLRYVSVPSSGRTVGLLLGLADQHGTESDGGVLIDLPLTQQEMAKAAATSREAVARTLRKLRERGLVRTSRQRIVLVNVEVLRSLVDSVSDDA
ncbi:MAG TPA: Crp/Fnr family transcriptional regulator [Actinoplanes sp.]|nr:Crp/Fnr family transcriptional regulator [Actinoplanes sp.]